MKKIAVFGKPGSGKSTLGKNLSAVTGIQLYQLDSMLYKKSGEQVDGETFAREHESILSSESWIVDGFGPVESFNKRLNMADTLIYIDLPYVVSYWLVTKRLLKGLFVKPEGWPEGSSILKGTWQSYKVLRRCPRFWNDDFLQNVEEVAIGKSLFVIRSVSELDSFVEVNVEVNAEVSVEVKASL